jgi:phospholipase C
VRLVESSAIIAACLLLTACSSATSVSPVPMLIGASSASSDATSKIKHIVIIVQENRTVDNLFNGLKGADTVNFGFDHLGHRVPFHIVKFESAGGPCHSHTCWVTTYDGGKLDGWDLVNPKGSKRDFDYARVEPSETKLYFAMAQKYAFADRMFQSNSGPSYPAHQYLIAGRSQLVDENPVLSQKSAFTWGCDSPAGTTTLVLGPDGEDHRGPFPCFDYASLADTMDANGVTWRYYATALGQPGAIWSAFDAINHIRFGPDWSTDVVSPETKVLADLAAGNLADVTWVTPNRANSDHPGNGGMNNGPEWVASVVNAVGESQFWNSTTIFITWDDWGGWYDHVKPERLDAMGLGYRVPLVVISPYARLGYVSHVEHEFGSIMKFTEKTFNLPSLGNIDARADDLSDCFDFSQPPTRFTPFKTTLTPSFFQNMPQTGLPPDDD